MPESVSGACPRYSTLKKRPWIQPDRAEPDSITAVVLRCPSGALQFGREDGVRETPPEENVIAIAENGPLYARGDIEIKSPEGDTLFRGRPA